MAKQRCISIYWLSFLLRPICLYHHFSFHVEKHKIKKRKRCPHRSYRRSTWQTNNRTGELNQTSNVCECTTRIERFYNKHWISWSEERMLGRKRKNDRALAERWIHSRCTSIDGQQKQHQHAPWWSCRRICSMGHHWHNSEQIEWDPQKYQRKRKPKMERLEMKMRSEGWWRWRQYEAHVGTVQGASLLPLLVVLPINSRRWLIEQGIFWESDERAV